MMSLLFLLDIRPGPAPIAGVGGLILLAVLVLIFAAALIVGFVFLLRQLKRAGGSTLSKKLRGLKFTSFMLGDVCFSFEEISPNAISHKSPSGPERQH
jgi:hypothetical protein